MNLTLPHLTVIIEGAECQNDEKNAVIKDFLDFFKSQLDIVFKEHYLIELNPKNNNFIVSSDKENSYIKLRILREKIRKNLSEYLSGEIPFNLFTIDAEGNCNFQLTGELKYRFSQAISDYKKRNKDKK